MNCRRTQDLIPLYVGGDLKDARALEVASHLDSCDECRGVMDEFSESQQWARTAAEPDFDEAFFDDLRQSVFAQIESAKARPSFFQFLRERMSLKPALALTVALMILAMGMAFYIYSGGTKNDSRNGLTAGDKEKKQEEQTVAPLEKEEKEFRNHRPRRPRARQPDAIAVKRQQPYRSARQIVSKNADRTRLEWQTSERETMPGGMTRIEFHTSDPNIRIIWLAPKEKDSTESKPLSKESGVRSQKSETGLMLRSAF